MHGTLLASAYRVPGKGNPNSHVLDKITGMVIILADSLIYGVHIHKTSVLTLNRAQLCRKLTSLPMV